MNISLISSIVTQTLIYAAPLILTALGGVFSERSGIVNVGLEGIMVMGAFSSIVFNIEFASQFGAWTPWLGMLVGGLVGMAFSLLHAVATINFRADHIISGTVMNLMAPALAVFLVKAIYNKGQTDNIQQTLGYFNFPVLRDIPVMRYSGVLISGFLGGMGGALFAQSIAGRFAVTTIAGQGFISMAAMIFGKWNPLGAMGAAIFFGFAQNISIVGGQLPIISSIPAVYLQAAPYALTIIVLVLFLGKAAGPKANGKNYIKSK